MLGIIIGCSVGGGAFLLIMIFVVYKVADYYRWKKWMAENGLDEKPLTYEDKALQYPITDR